MHLRVAAGGRRRARKVRLRCEGEFDSSAGVGCRRSRLSAGCERRGQGQGHLATKTRPSPGSLRLQTFQIQGANSPSRREGATPGAAWTCSEAFASPAGIERPRRSSFKLNLSLWTIVLLAPWLRLKQAAVVRPKRRQRLTMLPCITPSPPHFRRFCPPFLTIQWPSLRWPLRSCSRKGRLLGNMLTA